MSEKKVITKKNWKEELSNLQAKYPELDFKILGNNDKIKRETIIEYFCEKCNNKSESRLGRIIGKNDNNNIICKYCCRQKNKIYNKCKICNITAYYGYSNDTVATYCGNHKLINMIHIKNKKKNCIVCHKTLATFNYPHKKIAKYCNKCKQNSMINVVRKKCIICKNTSVSYGLEKSNIATHCFKCKSDDMINLLSNKCISCKKKRRCFGYADTLKATHCKDCSLEKMIDLCHKKCIICHIKRATFNYKEKKTPSYCKDCSLEKMVDVVNKNEKCIVCQKKVANYNFKEEPTGKYCFKCRDKNMIIIRKIRKCIICKKKQPSFANLNENIALYCKDCSTEKTISINNKCIVCNTTQASYGYCGQKASMCAKCISNKNIKHITFNKPKRKCLDCEEISTYGIKEPTHCYIHKTEDEICLLAQKCRQCSRIELLTNEGFCIVYCRPIMIDKYIKNENKIKESLVLKFIDDYIDINYLSVFDDKAPQSICNLKRPDRLYDMGKFCLCIEVDEFQHKDYKCENTIYSEEVRMLEISQACGLKTIFIRFNPDSFKINNVLCKKYNIDKRLLTLKKWIDYFKEYEPDINTKQITYVKLFYDEYDETNVAILKLDEKDIFNLQKLE